MKFRHEYKHAVNLSDMMCLERKLSAFCKYDSHAERDGTYTVKSLYFDNYLDKALREKTDGVNFREKFRIRYYGNDTSFIRLEKKSKINGLCNKVSTVITERQCQNIINGSTSFLMESDNGLFRELYAKMNYQLLRPKSIVAYTRKCFVYPPENVRITLDYNIGGSTNEEYLAKYHEYYGKLVDEYLYGGKFEETYTGIRSQIDDLVKTDPTAMYGYDSYLKGTETLYELIMLRAKSVKGQLDGTVPSTSDGQKADSSALVDASHINTSDLGSMGGFGGGGGFGGNRGNQPSKDRTQRSQQDNVQQNTGQQVNQQQNNGQQKE